MQSIFEQAFEDHDEAFDRNHIDSLPPGEMVIVFENNGDTHQGHYDFDDEVFITELGEVIEKEDLVGWTPMSI